MIIRGLKSKYLISRGLGKLVVFVSGVILGIRSFIVRTVYRTSTVFRQQTDSSTVKAQPTIVSTVKETRIKR